MPVATGREEALGGSASGRRASVGGADEGGGQELTHTVIAPRLPCATVVHYPG